MPADSNPARPESRRQRRSAGWRRGPLLTALGVALVAVGCAPAGPKAAPQQLAGLRHQISLPGTPLNPQRTLSVLRSADEAGAVLVLVHGTPGEALGWADYVLAPPAGVQVVAIDRPGFGDSGPNGALPSLADQAAAVLAVLPSDGRPVVLLGHSLGGPVVARVAADHPERVQAVVLLAAAMDPALERIHPLQHLGAWAPVRHWLPRPIRNANTELMALEPELRDLAQRLPAVRARVLIVHGTQDSLVPVANVPYMQRMLTGAACVRTVLLSGQDHFLPWQAVDAVHAAVQAALAPAC